MRLPPFELLRPRSSAEAFDVLARYGDDAMIYMGGTELLLVMKLGFAAPAYLVDCKSVSELHGVNLEDPDQWSIGAATTHRRLELGADVRRALPALANLESQVANIRVRNVGTIGGSICFAEPHSDPATLLVALQADVVLLSSAGARKVPLEDFIQGPLMTRIEPGELLSRLVLRPVHPKALVRFQRLVFTERPIANLAYVVADGAHRLVVGAVGSRPTRLRIVEALLEAGEEDLTVLADAACSEVEPLEDLEGSVDYKRHLVGVLTRRILTS